MIYSMNQVVPSYLCDRNDHLHPWAAVRLCQEVTEYHGNSVGGGFDKLVKENRAWVIVRSYYEFYRRPNAFEKVMLNTWPRGNDGLFAFRDYHMEDANGEVLLTGTSYWSLIDFERRRVVRLADYINVYEVNDELATKYSTLDKLRMPPFADSDTLITMTSRYSMIDHTGHVNNSEYIKWIFDALNELQFDFDKPFGLELNFQHETKPGDNVTVMAHRDGDTYYAQVVNSQGIGVVARISTLR